MLALGMAINEWFLGSGRAVGRRGVEESENDETPGKRK